MYTLAGGLCHFSVFSLSLTPPKDPAVGNVRTDSTDQQAAGGREGLDLSVGEQGDSSGDGTGHDSGEK